MCKMSGEATKHPNRQLEPRNKTGQTTSKDQAWIKHG
jgi:hypothetical protein